ncbi:PREDICTED: serine/arginine repetitive matrix protein 1-like [Cyprinodon variegatus]|uniref:serine/arginine repetitive matrix protein 1-like n=1 Tax=Cyprinodon variegatus TaxID=28743 RepID=UPI000742991C|nr:PREDICTED: serine/arginine repetitive matrix protein 1-like [Cyprinodon variegatus]
MAPRQQGQTAGRTLAQTPSSTPHRTRTPKTPPGPLPKGNAPQGSQTPGPTPNPPSSRAGQCPKTPGTSTPTPTPAPERLRPRHRSHNTNPKKKKATQHSKAQIPSSTPSSDSPAHTPLPHTQKIKNFSLTEEERPQTSQCPTPTATPRGPLHPDAPAQKNQHACPPRRQISLPNRNPSDSAPLARGGPSGPNRNNTGSKYSRKAKQRIEQPRPAHAREPEQQGHPSRQKPAQAAKRKQQTRPGAKAARPTALRPCIAHWPPRGGRPRTPATEQKHRGQDHKRTDARRPALPSSSTATRPVAHDRHHGTPQEHRTRPLQEPPEAPQTPPRWGQHSPGPHPPGTLLRAPPEPPN